MGALNASGVLHPASQPRLPRLRQHFSSPADEKCLMSSPPSPIMPPAREGVERVCRGGAHMGAGVDRAATDVQRGGQTGRPQPRRRSACGGSRCPPGQRGPTVYPAGTRPGSPGSPKPGVATGPVRLGGPTPPWPFAGGRPDQATPARPMASLESWCPGDGDPRPPNGHPGRHVARRVSGHDHLPRPAADDVKSRGSRTLAVASRRAQVQARRYSLADVSQIPEEFGHKSAAAIASLHRRGAGRVGLLGEPCPFRPRSRSSNHGGAIPGPLMGDYDANKGKRFWR